MFYRYMTPTDSELDETRSAIIRLPSANREGFDTVLVSGASAAEVQALVEGVLAQQGEPEIEVWYFAEQLIIEGRVVKVPPITMLTTPDQ